MMAKSQDIACIAMHSVQDKELTQMYSETIVNSIINKGIYFGLFFYYLIYIFFSFFNNRKTECFK